MLASVQRKSSLLGALAVGAALSLLAWVTRRSASRNLLEAAAPAPPAAPAKAPTPPRAAARAPPAMPPIHESLPVTVLIDTPDGAGRALHDRVVGLVGAGELRVIAEGDPAALEALSDVVVARALQVGAAGPVAQHFDALGKLARLPEADPEGAYRAATELLGVMLDPATEVSALEESLQATEQSQSAASRSLDASGADTEYSVEFDPGQLALTVETDFYGINASIKEARPELGISQGDIIVAVNGHRTLNDDYEGVVQLLKQLKRSGGKLSLRKPENYYPPARKASIMRRAGAPES